MRSIGGHLHPSRITQRDARSRITQSSRKQLRVDKRLNYAARFLAAAGDEARALRLLDSAAALLPPGDVDEELPFLMLNQTHLARWRGNCLSTLGADEAVDDLTAALEGNHGLTSARAETGLRVDLAVALQKRGDINGSKLHAARASELARLTGSARQRSRIAKLLAAA